MCYAVTMAKHYTPEDVRRRLNTAVAIGTQADLSRKMGIAPQNLSTMVKGGPIHGKALAWLGFRKVTLYERIEAKHVG